MVKRVRETKKMQLVEDMGLVLQEAAIPRMAGRIYGWLLICHPPHQCAAELAQVLGGSKGSISTMTRLLIQMGLIERVALPGERSAYYHIKPGCWSEMLRKQMTLVSTVRQLSERGLALMKSQKPQVRLRLQEMHNIHAFFEREFPALLERWERHHVRSK